MDKTEAMLGSYGPQQAAYTKVVSLLCDIVQTVLTTLSLHPKNPPRGCSLALARTPYDRESSTTINASGSISNGVGCGIQGISLTTGFKLAKEW